MPLSYAHPAAPTQAACITHYLGGSSFPVFDAIGESEWSTDLLEGNTPAPVHFDTAQSATLVSGDSTLRDTRPLRDFAVATLCAINALNDALARDDYPAQVVSVELTFQLRKQHPPAPRIWHVDHAFDDNSTGVFIVALGEGSAATRLSAEEATWGAEARCAALADSDEGGACAATSPGAATYLPLRACHARPAAPLHTAAAVRRDVAAVHVGWAPHAPPIPLLLRHWQQSTHPLRCAPLVDEEQACSSEP